MRHANTLRSSPAADLGSMSFLVDGSRRDRRSFRLGIIAAILVHAAVFLANWPNLATATAAVDDRAVFIQRLSRFEFVPPDPTTPRTPDLPARVVPIPDPTPFDPEPLPSERPVQPEQVDLGDLIPYDVDVPAPPPDPVAAPSEPIRVLDPEVVRRVKPEYTAAALKARIQGPVVIDMVIDHRGYPTQLSVLRGQPLGLTEAAVAAVRQWRFEPMHFGDRPVPVRYTLTVWFRLD